jgi:programmed cell death 6-interacting protein
MKNATIARLASKVSEYYSEALAAANAAKGANGQWPFSFPSVSLPTVAQSSANLLTRWGQEWINHVNVKRLHFAAAAQYRKSCDDLAANL